MDRAWGFFGEGGEDLEETERNPFSISFRGGGGSVTVWVPGDADETARPPVPGLAGRSARGASFLRL